MSKEQAEHVLASDMAGTTTPAEDAATTEYLGEIVTRTAPRWAWEVIDETLSMDTQSSAFTPEFREQIQGAYEAMIDSCERMED